MDNQMPKFEEWALVELFGHQRIAGKVTEQRPAAMQEDDGERPF